MPVPYRLEDAEEFIERSQEKVLKQEFKTYMIFHNKKMIGGIELRDFNEHSCELGYWLGKKYWGKGFATEAVGRLLELGFDELNLNEIYAAYKVGNEASKKVLEKSGFQFYRLKEEFDSVLEKNEQLIEMVIRK
jgi:RimJ/RimL family protein N-acetyltransferase